ncbi:hypothetical protein KI809_17665 [Geobacter pelophilus]|uniref:Uncharacterized protein n=1 Tax=Geoanaerobacter pelophilus TaxID=60036 RepID=A0AAW4LE11_9BACT|nr:hypothetical protein [Geoanaerobacter pelophilus]MBT0666142.1 hypothetical protein [Geoanaerobacter pelophilus]
MAAVDPQVIDSLAFAADAGNRAGIYDLGATMLIIAEGKTSAAIQRCDNWRGFIVRRSSCPDSEW